MTGYAISNAMTCVTYVGVEEAVTDEEEGALQRVADGEEVGEDERGR